MAIHLLFFSILCSFLVPYGTLPFFHPTAGARRGPRCTLESSSRTAILVRGCNKSYFAFRRHSVSNRRSAAGGKEENTPFHRNNGSPPSSVLACVFLSPSFPPSSSCCSCFSFSSSVLGFFTLQFKSCSLRSPTSPALHSRHLSFLAINNYVPTYSSSSRRILFSSLSSPSDFPCISAALEPSTSASPSVFFPHLTLPSYRFALSLFYPVSSTGSVTSTRLNVYRNKVRHINPVRRVKHLRRNSGQTHVHELARERYLLHRQKDVRDYCRLLLSPHQHLSPSSCPHSQRNAAIKHPFRGINRARKIEFARLNREDDAKDENRLQALKEFLDLQKGVLLQGQERGEASSTAAQLPEPQADSRALGEQIVSAYAELQQLLRKRRMLRPLGSNKLFICNVDGRLANPDLEDFFDFFFDQTRVRLHKNADGVAGAAAWDAADGSHRGSGIIRFVDTMQATQCLLEFNGVRLGDKNIFLAEALGPPLKKKEKKTYPRPPFPNGVAPLYMPTESG